jgi:DNA-binding MarR family transcriptional regulator
MDCPGAVGPVVVVTLVPKLDSILTSCQDTDMRSERRTPEGETATHVVLSTFRVNGLLLAAGDMLTAGEGLTAARWQVLGAIALADRPLTVPQIARRMGLARQSVHPTVKRLVRDGLLEFTPNTDHRRSQLVRMTKIGWAAYAAIDARQAAWVNRLAEGIGRTDLATTARVLDQLCRRLESNSTARPDGDEGGDE